MTKNIFLTSKRLSFRFKKNSENGAETIFKDIHREKPTLNKTPALMKSMNMGLWQVVNSYPPSIRN